jgi:hypothetical protein
MLRRSFLIGLTVLSATVSLISNVSIAATTAAATQPSLAVLREDERTTVDLLRQVNQQLADISIAAATTAPAETSATRARRLKALEETKKRYQFRLDELSRELREIVVRLSVDGLGVPGRLSAAELELKDLLQKQFELARTANNAQAATESAKKLIEKGIDPPPVQERMDKDPEVLASRQRLRDVELEPVPADADGAAKTKQKAETAKRQLDDVTAAVRAKATAALVEQLRQRQETAQGQLLAARERVDAAKMDLGDLSNAMNHYLTLKGDETATRDRLREVNDQMDELAMAEKVDPREEKVQRDNVQLERAMVLNNLKQRYQFHLQDVRNSIRQTEADQLSSMFAGTVDVFVSPDEVKANAPSIAGATFEGMVELSGKPYVRLKSPAGVWSIDPARILAVRAAK